MGNPLGTLVELEGLFWRLEEPWLADVILNQAPAPSFHR